MNPIRHMLVAAMAGLYLCSLGWMMWKPLPPKPAPVPAPLEVPVPLQEFTTDAGTMLASVLPGSLPKPGPNQLRSGQCDSERAQVEVNGGCWVQTKTPPPCPRGKQWEHEGSCWLPVAPAKPIPTSGGAVPRGVAEP